MRVMAPPAARDDPAGGFASFRMLSRTSAILVAEISSSAKVIVVLLKSGVISELLISSGMNWSNALNCSEFGICSPGMRLSTLFDIRISG